MNSDACRLVLLDMSMKTRQCMYIASYHGMKINFGHSKVAHLDICQQLSHYNLHLLLGQVRFVSSLDKQ